EAGLVVPADELEIRLRVGPVRGLPGDVFLVHHLRRLLEVRRGREVLTERTLEREGRPELRRALEPFLRVPVVGAVHHCDSWLAVTERLHDLLVGRRGDEAVADL